MKSTIEQLHERLARIEAHHMNEQNKAKMAQVEHYEKLFNTNNSNAKPVETPGLFKENISIQQEKHRQQVEFAYNG